MDGDGVRAALRGNVWVASTLADPFPLTISASFLLQSIHLTPPLLTLHPATHHTQAEECAPIDCVAVEDSGSGVGSAANAGMGASSACVCVPGLWHLYLLLFACAPVSGCFGNANKHRERRPGWLGDVETRDETSRLNPLSSSPSFSTCIIYIRRGDPGVRGRVAHSRQQEGEPRTDAHVRCVGLSSDLSSLVLTVAGCVLTDSIHCRLPALPAPLYSLVVDQPTDRPTLPCI